jgi:hypothetical protein
MFVTACAFMLVARRYKEESYIQNRDEKPRPLTAGEKLTELMMSDNK